MILLAMDRRFQYDMPRQPTKERCYDMKKNTIKFKWFGKTQETTIEKLLADYRKSMKNTKKMEG